MTDIVQNCDAYGVITSYRNVHCCKCLHIASHSVNFLCGLLQVGAHILIRNIVCLGDL